MRVFVYVALLALSALLVYGCDVAQTPVNSYRSVQIPASQPIPTKTVSLSITFSDLEQFLSSVIDSEISKYPDQYLILKQVITDMEINVTDGGISFYITNPNLISTEREFTILALQLISFGVFVANQDIGQSWNPTAVAVIASQMDGPGWYAWLDGIDNLHVAYNDPNQLPNLVSLNFSGLEVDDSPMSSEQSTGCPQGCTIPPSGCLIKGNISFDSGEKIFHVPGQEYYEQTTINPSYGERWFCIEAEAIGNGWRKAYK